MSIAERSVAELTEVTQEIVGADAHVQVALMVYGRNPLISAGFLGWVFGRPRILAATDDDIRLYEGEKRRRGAAPWRPASSWPPTPATPRSARPRASTTSWSCPTGQKVYIHRLHFDHVRRIDGEVVED